MLSPNLAHIRSFEVIPSLPRPLAPLLEIANNLWWTWHPEAVSLFKQLDSDLWDKCHHNPVQLIGNCSQGRLNELAGDDGFLASMQQVLEIRRRHFERVPWLQRHGKDPGQFVVGYFCAEYGLTECLQIYSGGLGCLAGDHLKSSGELGLPLVGVGLLYRHGYFQQYLNDDGWQQEYYPDLDCTKLPMAEVTDAQGRQLKVSVQLLDRQVQIGLWKVQVGRIDLYLLDTNLSENDEADRAITGHLYGGDMEMRIKQEIVLGIGGVRALAACGIEPDVCHMNEGHSAFLSLERIRILIEKHDLSFDEAREYAVASHVFTTHTPVPAGIDRFPPEIIYRYFKHYHDSLRLDAEGLIALGREDVSAKNEPFSMAVLAIRTAQWYNGVSALHGRVSRNMWQEIWPGVLEQEIPIRHITNGVHARSWLSADLISLLDSYLGKPWQQDTTDHGVWKLIHKIPDEELWQVREQCRQHLILWVRQQLRGQLESRGADPGLMAHAASVLDPNVLTIGFARRFATYKRASLLLHDPDRLKAMLSNEDRPLQFLIAGKAHPADTAGKELIRQIVHFARELSGNRSIVFLENYDINVAKYLVQGCDVWLNTPRRGMEASGTSGMKAALNGGLNCSVMDGWWDEAHDSALGWAIGQGESYIDVDAQDDIESQLLYDLLERQIIPTFYDRDEHNIPREWVLRMKKCISSLAPVFNTNRMVQQYTENFYLPALQQVRLLGANGLEKSVALAHQKQRLRNVWDKLYIDQVQSSIPEPMRVGDQIQLSIIVQIDHLQPEELRVQVYFGALDNDGRIIQGQVLDMKHAQDLGDGRHCFTGGINSQSSGRFGYAVRMVPGGEMFQSRVEPGMVCWDRHEPQLAPAIQQTEVQSADLSI